MNNDSKYNQRSPGFEPFADAGAPDPEPLRPPPKRHPGFKIRIARTLLLTGTASFIILMGAFFLWLDELQVFSIDHDRIQLIAKHSPSDNSLVYDRDGQKIGEFFNAYHVYVPYAQIPKDMLNAIIAIEDRNFWTHQGFDPRGILRAAVVHLKGRTYKQGASTITQQLVRHFLLPKERSIQRKVQEIAFAIHLEKTLSKEQIIELYANSLFLGNGSYGIGAAAYRYFGKPTNQLATHEMAVIAGLFQSPSRYNPKRFPKRAKTRQIQVLSAMQQAGMITQQQAKALIKEPLNYSDYKPLNTVNAPYFLDHVRAEATRILAEKAKGVVNNQGLRIYTTLDSKLQKIAEKVIADAAPALNDAQKRAHPVRNPQTGEMHPATVEAATISVDPRTGEILTMVGGRDYQHTKFNRTTQALRSPGSAFKPVVYSLAISGSWKWSDMIFVSPISISNYRPKTPEEDFLTETTLMRAFYRSMNTPTIELGEKLGLLPVIEHARKLGIKTPIKEEFGSMLGSSDATLIDMVRLYSSFANAGNLVEPIAISKITDREGHTIYEALAPAERSTIALTPQIAYLMTQGMRAVLTMGTGFRSAHLGDRAAGKTGTSNDSTDNWFCGYSPDLVNIVWTGTDEHAPMPGDITGGKLSLPIWDKFMTEAFTIRPPQPFEVPPGVVSAVVHPRYGNRSASGVRMSFLKGHEPNDGNAALEVLSNTEENYRGIFSH